MSIDTSPDFPAQTPSRAGSLTLLGGSLCLNFCNTTSGRGTSQVQEHLRSFENLFAWGKHADAVDPASARQFERTPPSLAEGERVLHRGLALRTALHSIFSSAMAGVAAPAPAMATLNDMLAQAAAAMRVQQTPGGFSWDWVQGPWSGDRLLWPIARSAAELLTAGDLSRLRVCPGCFCGWMFLDRTRNRRRRWCEMEICGSRDKMRRYHQRQRDLHRPDIRADAPF